MPAVIWWLIGTVATVGVSVGVESLITGGSTNAPSADIATTTFDWQGLILGVGISLIVSLVIYSIFKKRK